MSEAKLRRWDLEEFLAWEEHQAAKYELVDGQPMMMTGGTQAHWVITGNIVAALNPLLRGSRCRSGASDIRIITGTGNVRYPDAAIDCGPFRPGARDASKLTVAFEVLSRTTAWVDLHEKLRDYDATPSIQRYVIISQDEPRAIVWLRDDSERLAVQASVTGLDGAIDLGISGINLPMADIYTGISFEPGNEEPAA